MLFLSVRPTLFLVQSRSLSGRHVSTGFLDPVLGAMMKQVCWHSRRSKAYRGLPEARFTLLFHCVSYSHHFRCDPALSVFASKCQGECHAVKAALCDLGDPGWGDPWFPH